MTKQNKLFKTTMLVTLIIILSKIAGFIREAVLAASFGQSLEKSAYLTAFQIINIFTIFFSVGISSSFIPVYMRRRLDHGERNAAEYASNVLNLYILCSLLTIVLGTIFAPQLSGLVWNGSQEGLELVTEITRIMMPSFVFWAVCGVLVNILNARKHFVPEQLMGFALSFCVILVCIFSNQIEMVAIATSVSAVVQIIILLPFLKGRFKYRFKLDLKDHDLRLTFRLAIPAFISAAFDELNTLVDTKFASAMGDNVPSAINESFRLGQPILGVLVVPITTIMFTQLSGYAAKKETGEFKRTIRSSIEIIALITIPVIVFAFLLQTDLIGLFYERGKYTHQDTLFAAPIFGFYIIGLIGYGLRSFFARVFYSLQQTWTPMIIGACAVGLNIFLDFALKDVLGARGLTLATSIASISCAIIMVIVLRKRIGLMGLKKSAGQFIRILISVAVGAAIVILLLNILPIEGTTFINRLIRILVCGLSGLAVYMLMAFLLRVETTGKLLDIVKSKLRRKKA